MSTFSIVLIVYFAIAISIAVFVFIRSRKPLTPLDNLLEKKKKPLWQILLPFPIYPIAGVFYGIILLVDPKERRNLSVKRYLKTQTDFDREYEELNVAKIDIEEGVDEKSPYKKAALCLAKELQSGKFKASHPCWMKMLCK
ncbi:MAG: hypothetical protein IJ524_05065 [Bacteroidales bacterium]|nr:hypothetical protein [Bacteroidales bacterium]